MSVFLPLVGAPRLRCYGHWCTLLDRKNIHSRDGVVWRYCDRVMDRWTTFAKTGNLNPTYELIGFETSSPDVVGVN